jgi:ankyrin repeat protein
MEPESRSDEYSDEYKEKRNLLSVAIQNRSVNHIKESNLDMGALLYKDENGDTPLMEAIKKSGEASNDSEKKQCLNIIKVILKKMAAAKAEIDTLDSNGRTALIEAITHSDPEVVNLLLQHNPNLNIRITPKVNLDVPTENQDIQGFHEGAAALEVAFEFGGKSLDAANAILENMLKNPNANPEYLNIAQNNEGDTALMLTIKAIATYKRDERKARAIDILKKNAIALVDEMSVGGLAVENTQGETALMLAAEIGDLTLFNAIFEKFDKKPVFNGKFLTSAIEGGNPGIIKFVLAGVDVTTLKSTDERGNTKLMLAAATGNFEIFGDILKKYQDSKIDIKQKAENGKTLLLSAVMGENPDIIKAVLGEMVKAKDFSSLNVLDNIGVTALMRIICSSCIKNNDKLEIIKTILQYTSPDGLNVQDTSPSLHKETALMWAIRQENPDLNIIKAILEKTNLEGLSIKNKYGKPAVTLAEEKEYKEISVAVHEKIDQLEAAESAPPGLKM